MSQKKWSPEKIGDALLPIIKEYGHIPSNQTMKKLGYGALAKAISRNGGFREWNERMGCDPISEEWSEDKIITMLRPYIERLGRMPSHNELKADGNSKLGHAIVRHGGFEEWSVKMNAPQKRCSTTIGRNEEEEVAKWLRSKGFEVVRQTMRAPYDLLVDEFEVDVKAAHKSDDGYFQFQLNNKDHHNCDFYILSCLDENDVSIARYVIPSDKCPPGTISLAGKQIYKSKYEKWFDAYEEMFGY